MKERKSLLDHNVSRRSFLKLTAAVGGATAVGARGLTLSGLKDSNKAKAAPAMEKYSTTCVYNCGGARCILFANVEDGVIKRITTDETEDLPTMPQARGCARGRALKKQVYNPDRLKYPMKRVGKRGEGNFQRISWEEAFETIVENMERIKKEYGNEAFYFQYGSGLMQRLFRSWPPSTAGPYSRLLHLYGGYLNHYGTYSSACYAAAIPYTYGSGITNTIDDLQNSQLIIFWASNKAETRLGGNGHMYGILEAKKKGAKVIVIDPRLSDTALSVADEWIPIKPTTDNALMDAIAYVMITEDLHDQDFLDKYCVGFDEKTMPEGVPTNKSYKAYVMGEDDDGIAKTPEWAEGITGVPKETIVRLAREIGTTKPCAMIQGLGWQRHAYGEQPVRGLPVLACMSGNAAIPGGGPGTRLGGHGVSMGGFPTLSNPLGSLQISVFTWTDAITHGKEMGAEQGVRGVEGTLPQNLKLMWVYGSNTLLNQHSDINRTTEILEDENLLEFILVHDVYMTPSAKFADILLPDCSHLEREDVATGGAVAGHAVFMNKAIEPIYETKDAYEVSLELAKRLGLEPDFSEGKTVEDWLREMVAVTEERYDDFPGYDEFKRIGYYKVPAGSTRVGLANFVADPEANPLRTPSGKIEIFSKALWDMNKEDGIPAVPKYISSWEGPEDPLTAKYPLQLFGHHTKRRAHSTLDNNRYLEDAEPQALFMNYKDAEERGLADGDMVKIFNDRGVVVCPVKITKRIMPGCASLPQGAWYEPDESGTDRRGSINVLTSLKPTPLAFGNPQHTNLVEVEKA